MSDLPDALHERAARALVASRVSHARYLQLLKAQQAALHARDLDLLARLAAESLGLLRDLEAGIRLPDDVLEALNQAEGPRRDDVQRLLETVQFEVAGAHTEIRQFAAALEARKREMLGALSGLHPPGPAESSGLLPPADSAPKGLPPPDDSVR